MTTTDTGLAGTLLERRYRVDSLLARGGMSSVYRGTDTRLDRPVAIKIMDPRFADDRSFVERFEREARSAARLHHPNIVTVHDQGVDGEHAFLVMELVEGGTLRDLLDQRGRLDGALALTVTEQMLEALSAAHEAGLVHRDVKPENVLIGRTGTPPVGVVKVADFGLVRAVASSGATSSSVILGTVAYLSPEQVTAGAAGERGDVYSAGVVLYEMLTGQAPYTGDTAISVAYRHVNDDVPAPSTVTEGIPAALDELVRRATRRDPAARPADAAAFLVELRQVRASLGMPAVAIPPLPGKADQVPAVERTIPAFSAVSGTVPVAGPRGTRAMPRPAHPTIAAPMAPVPPPVPHPPAPAGQEPPRRRPSRTVLLRALVVLVLGGVIGAMVWWFAGGGKEIAASVDIPAVAGMDGPTAQKTLQDKGLSATVTQQLSNTVGAGLAIGTDPTAGSSVPPNTQVTLLMSAGKPKVPSVVGSTTEQATSLIVSQQLKAVHDSGADNYSTTVPQGQVLSVSPQAGTPVNIGTTVTYGVSKGVPPTPVPNVAGLTRAQAFQLLQSQGFQPYDAGTEFSASVPAGSVTRTSPAANSAPQDKRIGVFTSNAVAVPQLFGMGIDQAVQTLSAAGLQSNGGGGGRHGFGIVVGQDPAAGTPVPQGTTVKLQTFP
ncbi:MAG TPA: Stk1 family PASTA domain-containing Ser/Thr kinase [Amycolatopsis sp.]|nr:Stk1 family PASTA domain-containing Ser/Thr kinase [Amycolatopsis sp.]